MRAAPLALILLATPAVAQDRPPAMQPTRDVAVTYRTNGGETVRMAWQANANRMRMDMPAQSAAMIVDMGARTAIMVMEPQRMAMRMAFDPSNLPFNPGAPDPSTRFVREGTATVAGLTCTNWRMEGGPHGTGSGCITADGVMLRGSGQSGGNAGSIEATEVRYGPQDPARFQVPAGFQTMDMGNLGAGGMPPGLGGRTPRGK